MKIVSLIALLIEIKTDSFGLNDIFEQIFEISARLLWTRLKAAKITQIEKKSKISIKF
jgi:hypothetical protein